MTNNIFYDKKKYKKYKNKYLKLKAGYTKVTKTITLNIILSNGSEKKIHISPEKNVKDLKQMIEIQMGISINQQNLFMNDHILNNTDIIKDIISNDSNSTPDILLYVIQGPTTRFFSLCNYIYPLFYPTSSLEDLNNIIKEHRERFKLLEYDDNDSNWVQELCQKINDYIQQINNEDDFDIEQFNWDDLGSTFLDLFTIEAQSPQNQVFAKETIITVFIKFQANGEGWEFMDQAFINSCLAILGNIGKISSNMIFNIINTQYQDLNIEKFNIINNLDPINIYKSNTNLVNPLRSFQDLSNDYGYDYIEFENSDKHGQEEFNIFLKIVIKDTHYNMEYGTREELNEDLKEWGIVK